MPVKINTRNKPKQFGLCSIPFSSKYAYANTFTTLIDRFTSDAL